MSNRACRSCPVAAGEMYGKYESMLISSKTFYKDATNQTKGEKI